MAYLAGPITGDVIGPNVRLWTAEEIAAIRERRRQEQAAAQEMKPPPSPEESS